MAQEQQLFIPTKIKVGYQKREDTYTKKLAYVIYFDSKGVLRKEASWEGWRDRTIDSDEFDNVPTEGFVLNKGVGGQRHSYGWNARNEYIRVYDPRGFEFEISVANLLYILQEATSTKGKGLEGEFVYSWEGKELVLLPVGSGAYKNSTEFTDLQSGKVSAKSLILGATYKAKTQEEYVYLGKFPYYTLQQKTQRAKYDYTSRQSYDYYNYIINSDKMHIFALVNSNNYVPFKNVSHLSKCIDENQVSNYAELIEDYNKTVVSSSKPVGIVGKPKIFEVVQKSESYWDMAKERFGYIKVSDDEYHKISLTVDYSSNYNHEYTYNGVRVSEDHRKVVFQNGELETKSLYDDRYTNTQRQKAHSIDDINNMGFMDVFVVLENGSEINFNNYNRYF
jgi:hypothetical protein